MTFEELTLMTEKISTLEVGLCVGYMLLASKVSDDFETYPYLFCAAFLASILTFLSSHSRANQYYPNRDQGAVFASNLGFFTLGACVGIKITHDAILDAILEDYYPNPS